MKWNENVAANAERCLAISAFMFILGSVVFGQTGGFSNRPWQNETYPIIIDPFHGNDLVFEQLITDRRVMGIIHKASQGISDDSKYKERAGMAKEKGLLYASYHLGTNIDPIRQADFYLSVIGENKSQPMALDIEDLGGNNISLPDAEKFIKRIFEKTGKYPMVYINNLVFNEINRRYDKNSVFAKCDLWYARFINSLPQLSKKVWDKTALWQFASEINCQVCLQKSADGQKCIRKSKEYTANCPYKIPGTANDIDVNVFNGSFDELKRFWSKPAAAPN